MIHVGRQEGDKMFLAGVNLLRIHLGRELGFGIFGLE